MAHRAPHLAPATRDRLHGVHVLLVDDHADTLEIFGHYLEHHGALVKRVESGHQAMATLALARPDVIVTDHAMGAMTGFVLLEHVRKMPGDAERPIPMILCSAMGGLEVSARAAGFGSYLVKPVDPPALVEEIARLAAGRSDTRPRRASP